MDDLLSRHDERNDVDAVTPLSGHALCSKTPWLNNLSSPTPTRGQGHRDRDAAGLNPGQIRKLDRELRSGDLPRAKAAFAQLKQLDAAYDRAHPVR